MEFDREATVGTAFAAQAAKARPSAWWWLLPPVMYVLHRRWYRAMRQTMLAQLTRTQREQVTSFQSKATGWFTVAAGATLLAAGETWQIVADYGWPVWRFWSLVAVLMATAVLTPAVRMIGDAHTAESVPARSRPATPGRWFDPARLSGLSGAEDQKGTDDGRS
ncbi:hypothetical protein ACI2LC_38065 [Nonomuraea wenchangensis]|uniref:hypothetical protein n=1 Tax=Nonomuraea wenchangensis TaxID=568860 RepID=UPI0033E12780